MSIVPRFYRDFDLTQFTTLKLKSSVKYYAPIYKTSDIDVILKEIGLDTLNEKLPCRILGGGSNLVLREKLNCIALHCRILGKKLLRETDTDYFVEIAAGENWDEAVLWTLQNGFNGLENLISIPGTVGAAPIQNIGAYGLEVSSRIEEVKGINLDNFKSWSLNFKDCEFSYRDSRFKNDLKDKVFITSVLFRLPKKYALLTHYPDVSEAFEKVDNKTAAVLASIIADIRQKKLPDPKILPNAGSFFKNPIISTAALEILQKNFPLVPHYPAEKSDQRKVAAGWLIEKCGWKGQFKGPIGMYEKQALILVNKDQGTFEDVSKVETCIREDVRKKFGLELEREPLAW